MGVFEHPKVLHDTEPAHVRPDSAQLVQRLTVPLTKRIEQRSPAVIRECLEHLVHGTHNM